MMQSDQLPLTEAEGPSRVYGQVAVILERPFLVRCDRIVWLRVWMARAAQLSLRQPQDSTQRRNLPCIQR